MFLITLTIHVKVDASDIVMINHVLHYYTEHITLSPLTSILITSCSYVGSKSDSIK